MVSQLSSDIRLHHPRRWRRRRRRRRSRRSWCDLYPSPCLVPACPPVRLPACLSTPSARLASNGERKESCLRAARARSPAVVITSSSLKVNVKRDEKENEQLPSSLSLSLHGIPSPSLPVQAPTRAFASLPRPACCHCCYGWPPACSPHCLRLAHLPPSFCARRPIGAGRGHTLAQLYMHAATRVV